MGGFGPDLINVQVSVIGGHSGPRRLHHSVVSFVTNQEVMMLKQSFAKDHGCSIPWTHFSMDTLLKKHLNLKTILLGMSSQWKSSSTGLIWKPCQYFLAHVM